MSKFQNPCRQQNVLEEIERLPEKISTAIKGDRTASKLDSVVVRLDEIICSIAALINGYAVIPALIENLRFVHDEFNAEKGKVVVANASWGERDGNQESIARLNQWKVPSLCYGDEYGK